MTSTHTHFSSHMSFPVIVISISNLLPQIGGLGEIVNGSDWFALVFAIIAFG